MTSKAANKQTYSSHNAVLMMIVAGLSEFHPLMPGISPRTQACWTFSPPDACVLFRAPLRQDGMSVLSLPPKHSSSL